MNLMLFGNPAGERPVSAVPVWVLIVLCFSIIGQVVLHSVSIKLEANEKPLPPPLSFETLNVISLGDQVALSKFIMLWLQGFDHQPGVSIPFSRLDYDVLVDWLDRVLMLDPDSQYALLSASRIYSEVPDNNRKRQMLEFVYDKFKEDPQKRWPWMAHAVYIAKHKIKDRDLALRYARVLREYTNGETVPNWARQLEIFIYEDFGDLESARILLGGLIESGEITDNNEIDFLMSRLDQSPAGPDSTSQ